MTTNQAAESITVNEMKTIATKEINGTTATLLEDDGVSIIRVEHNNSEPTEAVVGADASRNDQLTLAAWNVDFPVSELKEWIGDEAMDVLREDIKTNHWGEAKQSTVKQQTQTPNTKRTMKDFEIIFDNGGGAVLQLKDESYVASYNDMTQLAHDVRLLLNGGSPAGWDGHDSECYISNELYAEHAPNGGFRAIDGIEIGEWIANSEDTDWIVHSDDTDWHNMEAFKAAMILETATEKSYIGIFQEGGPIIGVGADIESAMADAAFWGDSSMFSETADLRWHRFDATDLIDVRNGNPDKFPYPYDSTLVDAADYIDGVKSSFWEAE